MKKMYGYREIINNIYTIKMNISVIPIFKSNISYITINMDSRATQSDLTNIVYIQIYN